MLVVVTNAADSARIFKPLVLVLMRLHTLAHLTLAAKIPLRVKLALRWKLDGWVTDCCLIHARVADELAWMIRVGKGHVSALVLQPYWSHCYTSL